MILSTDQYAKVIDKAVFPGGQGGPIMSQIAGKAVCFRENDTDEFRSYARQIIENASAMATQLQADGVRLVTGGTDNHLMLLDLRSIDPELTGREAAKLLDSIGITLNFNSIPNDPRPPMHTSGLRIGTPAMTTQGMGTAEATQTAALIARALKERGDSSAVVAIESEIRELAKAFPPYPADFAGHV